MSEEQFKLLEDREPECLIKCLKCGCEFVVDPTTEENTVRRVTVDRGITLRTRCPGCGEVSRS